MKKQSIVIASVLKPLDDTRMTEKMGMSLLKAGLWDAHIIGFGDRKPDVQEINFHSLGTFSRLSLTRIFTSWRILNKLFAIQPLAIIITTHELLWVAAIAKLFFKAKIYYDVRENYLLNILNTKAFPWILRSVIGSYVRLKEWIFSSTVKHFILAEKSYADELGFIGNRFTIIENKSVNSVNFSRKPIGNTIHFLFSGTLDESTGVFEAIALVRHLHDANQSIKLTVIGYAALPEIRKRIHQEAASHSFVELIGINSLVSHQKILEAISQADVGIIFYQPAPHTRNCIPTKLYEYLAHQLPIVYDKSATWASMVAKYHGGIPIDFKKLGAQAVLTALQTLKFYPQPPQDVTWEIEESKFLNILG